MEQFPNYAFWVEVGNLTAVSLLCCWVTSVKDQVHVTFFEIHYIRTPSLQDGCDFVCRSRNREEPPAYRGVATEPLEEEPEERDDHLLPM